MLPVFSHWLRRSAGAILGWGLSLGALGAFMIGFYDTFAGQSAQLENLLENYPPELTAFFGDMEKAFTPQGYLTTEFFSYMPLILGIFAVQAGSALIVTDEEAGTLDLVLAHPVSRTALFLGRLLALVSTLVAILGIAWLSFLLAAQKSAGLDFSGIELARPMTSLFAVLFFFSGFSLLLSLVLPSRSLATMVSGLAVTAAYFIQALSNINEDLKGVARYLPLAYYQSGEALGGLNVGWAAGLIGCGLLFCSLAWMLFAWRDIRVSGEGSWHLSLRRKPKTS